MCADVARDMIGERKSVAQDEQAAEPVALAAKYFPEADLPDLDKPSAEKRGH